MTITRTLTALAAAASLAACAAPVLEDYRPVTDPGAANSARYEGDLAQCQQIAKVAEADYKKRQSEQMGANMIAGVLLGALTGAAIGGSDWVGAGAAYGAASGIGATDFEQAHGGPRRIIDRCMNQRGHAILSDLGRA